MLSIVYQNKIIYSNLTEEECTDILFELAEKSYDGQLDPNQIKIEETKNG